MKNLIKVISKRIYTNISNYPIKLTTNALIDYNKQLESIINNYTQPKKHQYLIETLDEPDKIKLERDIHSLFFKQKHIKLNKQDVKDDEKSYLELILKKEEFIKLCSLYFEIAYKNSLFKGNFFYFANIFYQMMKDISDIAVRKPHSYLNVYILLYFLKSKANNSFKRNLVNYYIQNKKLLSYQHFLTFINYSSKDVISNNNFDLYKPLQPLNPENFILNFIAEKSVNKSSRLDVKDINLIFEYLHGASPIKVKLSIFNELLKPKKDEIPKLIETMSISEILSFYKNLLNFEVETEDVRELVIQLHQEILRRVNTTVRLGGAGKLEMFFNCFISNRFYIDKDLLSDFFLQVVKHKEANNENHESYFYNLAEVFFEVHPNFMAKLFLNFYEDRIKEGKLTRRNISYLIRIVCYEYETVQDKSKLVVHLDFLNHIIKDLENFKFSLQQGKMDNTNMMKYISSINDLVELLLVICFMHGRGISGIINLDTFEFIFNYIVAYIERRGSMPGEPDKAEELTSESKQFLKIVYLYIKMLSNREYPELRQILLSEQDSSLEDTDVFKEELINDIKMEVIKIAKVKKYDFNFKIDGLLQVDNMMRINARDGKILILFPKRYKNYLNAFLQGKIVDVLFERHHCKYLRINYKEWLNNKSYKEEILSILLSNT
jgi:hypothetical protein